MHRVMAASCDVVEDSAFFLYLDDVGEEVEIRASVVDGEGPSCTVKTRQGKRKRSTGSEGKVGSKRKRKVLNKKEKEKVMLHLCDVDVNGLLSHIKDTIETEKHIQESKEKLEFWKYLEHSKALLTELTIYLADAFANLYKSCDKGKDKYMNFQLEWHRLCSVFLLPPDKDISDLDFDLRKHSTLASLQQRWIGFCEGKAAVNDVRCPVMISFCNAVYKYFLKRVSVIQQSLLDSTSSQCPNNIEPDTDSVYYRFCGGALADMLHGRYKNRQSCKSCLRPVISHEIQVLKCVQCVTKDHVPTDLKYRDNGYMYFPAVDFLPFLKALDKCVMENASDSAFKKYGSNVIEVAVAQMQANQELLKQFSGVVKEKLLEQKLDIQSHEAAIISVYKELSRKLCHTRLAEFVTATQQRAAAQQGKSTLAGQNLRDQLLCLHVNTKSQIK